MAESRVATLQGKNIGRLTRVTVVSTTMSHEVLSTKVARFIYL